MIESLMDIEDKRDADYLFMISWQATLSILEATLEMQTYHPMALFCMN